MAAVAQVLNYMGTFLQTQHICDRSSWQTLERTAHLDKGCDGTLTPAESDLQFTQGLTHFIKQLQDFVDTLQRDMGRNSESRAGTPSTDEDKCATVAMETSDQQNTSTLTPLVITPKTEDASDTNDSTTWKVTSDNDQQADKEKTDQNCSAIKVEVKEHNPPTLDINVQIKASKSEIERRIAAFIERKQHDVDEANRREFCNVLTAEQVENSCARTDAIFLPKPNSKSHVRVTRVVNQYGPQTRQYPTGSSAPHQRAAVGDLPDALEERLSNIEAHMKPVKGEWNKRSVYERLKVLEERILHLESLSPEYFYGGMLPGLSSTSKRKRTEDSVPMETALPNPVMYESMTLSEIEEKIRGLKRSLAFS